MPIDVKSLEGSNRLVKKKKREDMRTPEQKAESDRLIAEDAEKREAAERERREAAEKRRKRAENRRRVRAQGTRTWQR